MADQSRKFLSTYDVTARDIADRSFLIGAFLAGMLGTIALKHFEFSPWLIVAYPAAVLLAYCIACWGTGALALEPESIGDNCYYLGFLFTLGSLAYTLFRLNEVGGLGAEAQAKIIPVAISGFGVALSSTIVGVFLRILLLQLRPDLMVREREMRRDLATAASDLRRVTSAISREIKSTNVELAQHREEASAQLLHQLAEFRSETQVLLEKQANAYTDSIRGFTSQLSGAIESSIKQELDALLVTSRREADRLAAGFSEMVEIQSSASDALRQSGEHTSNLVAESSRLSEQTLRDIGEHLQGLKHSADTLVKTAIEASNDLEGTAAELGRDFKALSLRRAEEEDKMIEAARGSISQLETIAKETAAKLALPNKGRNEASEATIGSLGDNPIAIPVDKPNEITQPSSSATTRSQDDPPKGRGIGGFLSRLGSSRR